MYIDFINIKKLKHIAIMNLRNAKVLLFNLCIVLLQVQSASAQQYADCVKAKEICKKGTHEIKKTNGSGKDEMEAFPTPCFINGDVRGNAEMNSAWIKVKIAKSGTLKFTLRPTKYDDDLDFVVYKISGNKCENKKIVRCMAAGDKAYPSFCLGPTGLKDGETDISENAGCEGSNNGFLKPLSVKEGETYVILVSNVTSADQGFSIRLFGTCMLPCDEEKKTPPPPKEEKPIADAPPTPPVEVEKPQEEAPKEEPVVSKLPAEIEGRKTVISKTLEVKNRRISLKVWDNSLEDGDVISIYINGKKKFANITLTTKPQEFLLDLEAGENYITAHVESFGKREPNTAALSVHDGKKEQKLVLNATRNQEETMKVVVE